MDKKLKPTESNNVNILGCLLLKIFYSVLECINMLPKGLEGKARAGEVPGASPEARGVWEGPGVPSKTKFF